MSGLRYEDMTMAERFEWNFGTRAAIKWGLREERMGLLEAARWLGRPWPDLLDHVTFNGIVSLFPVVSMTGGYATIEFEAGRW